MIWVIILLAMVLALSLLPGSPLSSVNWGLFSLVIAGLVVLMLLWRFEHSQAAAKEVALVATMAAIAAIFRVPFVFIGGLQPTTFMVMITGYVFGAQTGFVVGALAALVSNFFLGQGPWTPWQMLGWGLCGVLAAILPGRPGSFKRVPFALLAGLCGYLFGWLMNLWHWLGFVYPLSIHTFLAVYAASFPFDTLHALGNVVFSLLFGRPFFHILSRFHNNLVPGILIDDDHESSHNSPK